MSRPPMFPKKRLPQKPIAISRKFKRLSYIDIELSKIIPFCSGFGERGVDGQYHVLYEVLERETDKNYIGIHSSDFDDCRYIGSGTELKKAIKQIGRHNFTRYNLAYFEHRQHLVMAEGLLVNSWFVKQKTNYNVSIGSRKRHFKELI